MRSVEYRCTGRYRTHLEREESAGGGDGAAEELHGLPGRHEAVHRAQDLQLHPALRLARDILAARAAANSE